MQTRILEPLQHASILKKRNQFCMKIRTSADAGIRSIIAVDTRYVHVTAQVTQTTCEL